MTYEQRAEALIDLAVVERELEKAKGKRRRDLLAQKHALGRKLNPGKCER